MNKEDRHAEIDALIARYTADGADTDAIRQLDDMARTSDADRQYIRNQLELWFSAAAATGSDADSEASYRRFEARIDAVPTARTKRLTPTWLKACIAAAAVVLAVVLPWAGYRYATERLTSNLASISITTPRGSTTAITLPDGTKAWINAGSTLSCSQGFGVTDRDIRLSGEACFDVAHNEQLPFNVTSKSATLRVTGTKFTYSDYPDDDQTTVELMRGSVDLRAHKSDRSVSMQPGERTTIDKRTGAMRKTTADTSAADRWTRGDLFFDEMPMENIARILARQYDARIEVAETLRDKTFYGNFNTKRQTLEQVLSAMAATKKMNYRKSNGTYLLY